MADEPEKKEVKEFSRADIRKLQEDNPQGCYMVVHNAAYNFAKYIDRHPGGRNLLLKNAGTHCAAFSASNNCYFSIQVEMRPATLRACFTLSEHEKFSMLIALVL